jgi:hypothetical protein
MDGEDEKIHEAVCVLFMAISHLVGRHFAPSLNGHGSVLLILSMRSHLSR